MRKFIAVAGLVLASALTLIMTMGMGAAQASPVQHAQLTSANISCDASGCDSADYAAAGIQCDASGCDSADLAAAGASSGSAPSSQSSSAPSAPSGGGTIGAIPGMPASLARCIAWRESSSVYGSTTVGNPAAGGNAYGIIPASGYSVAGLSIAQQNAVAGQIYATAGASAWTAFDGC